MGQRRLEGKVAIITGGAGGIGEATCERLAKAGAAVVVADINIESARKIADGICAGGDRAVAVQFDLLDTVSINDLVSVTMAEFGQIDVLHNNAVYNPPEAFNADGGFLEMDSTVWDNIFAGNVRAGMELVRSAAPHMIARGKGGAIINSSSGASGHGQLTMSAYGASKGALNSMTHYMATQFAPYKIRCNTMILPAVLTKGLEALFTEEQIEQFVSHTLMKEATRPADIAAVVEFLASDDAKMISGQLWKI
ncbi:SDR family NAD(P)-dependent oxidoreductase [Novosphingobium malaysiense]|uniref:SDR family NAD(P)-dependent oxidoreductase n=1 Tax=Novosphingobium malaysiense TaxID=1348853 RepID=UPI00068FDE89|nr:SDR family oxidoreductase [Novosphingobium malaysiense]